MDFHGFLNINEHPPSLEEVSKAIRNLKSHKAGGEDDLPPELLKHGGEVFLSAITCLITKIWKAECIPTNWRTAILLPFFKKGDKTLCKNYRGISLLDISFKVLECIISDRMRPAVEPYLRENQAGFRHGRGCIDQIFTLRHILQQRHEFRRPTVICFIDFSAAFDSVNRDAMWEIAAAKGVPSKIINMLKCLYQRTSCRVRVYNSDSKPFEVNSGVRQGSILSPLLFIMVNDWILEQSVDGHPEGVVIGGRDVPLADIDFADDIGLLAESEAAMQLLVNRLASTAAMVGMNISIAKTKILSCCCATEPLIHLKGEPIQVVDTFAYLGSDTNGCGDSSKEVRLRIAKAFGAFNKLMTPLWRQHDVSMRTKARIYDASVRSVLLYASETWTLKEADIKRLSVFEHKCWRRILGIRYTDHITNTEVRARFHHPTLLRDIIKARQIRWLGHILRMTPQRLPRQALSSQKQTGWLRPRGGVCKTWLRTLLPILEPHVRPYLHPGRPWANWFSDCHDLAQNRVQWRGLIRQITGID